MEIHAAERYESCDDLWTITCIFNPGGFQSKLDNYEIFAEPFRRAGLPLLTVECAFGDAPWQLPASDHVVQVRSNSYLWQKERLLNIALEHLPPQAKKVVWADADVLFANPQWAVQTSNELEKVAFLQPFREWCRLPRNHAFYRGEGLVGESFAYRTQTDPAAVYEGRQGAPGFVWAGRRDVLQAHGLYDACIIGAGDSMHAFAINRTTDTENAKRILGTLPPRPRGLINKTKHRLQKPRPVSLKFTEHYLRWAAKVQADVPKGMGFVPGFLLHLWHGSADNRNYQDRHMQMARFDFDPDADLWKNAHGAWEWSANRADMHKWARDYFRHRKEDG